MKYHEVRRAGAAVKEEKRLKSFKFTDRLSQTGCVVVVVVGWGVRQDEEVHGSAHRLNKL